MPNIHWITEIHGLKNTEPLKFIRSTAWKSSGRQGESSSATTLSAVPEGDSALPAGVVKGCGTEKPGLMTNFHDSMDDHRFSVRSRL